MYKNCLELKYITWRICCSLEIELNFDKNFSWLIKYYFAQSYQIQYSWARLFSVDANLLQVCWRGLSRDPSSTRRSHVVGNTRVSQRLPMYFLQKAGLGTDIGNGKPCQGRISWCAHNWCHIAPDQHLLNTNHHGHMVLFIETIKIGRSMNPRSNMDIMDSNKS